MKPGSTGIRPDGITGRPELKPYPKPDMDLFKDFFAPIIEESEADDVTKESFR